MTEKGQLRHDEIIAQTIVHLADRGVATLSFEALSKATGLAKPHIQYYFKSKEALLLVCFRHIAETAQKITHNHIEAKHTWQGRLRASVEAPFIWLDQYPNHAAVLFLYYHFCTVDAELVKVNADVRAIGRKRLEEILKAGLHDCSKSKISALAADIQMFLTGMIMEMASTRNFHDKQFIKRATSYVERLLDESLV